MPRQPDRMDAEDRYQSQRERDQNTSRSEVVRNDSCKDNDDERLHESLPPAPLWIEVTEHDISDQQQRRDTEQVNEHDAHF